MFIIRNLYAIIISSMSSHGSQIHLLPLTNLPWVFIAFWKAACDHNQMKQNVLAAEKPKNLQGNTLCIYPRALKHGGNHQHTLMVAGHNAPTDISLIII